MYSLSLSARLTRRPALKSLFAAVCAGLFAPAALAVPPRFTGQPITLPIPAIGNTVVVNLRQQGVITGSAPIGVDARETDFSQLALKTDAGESVVWVTGFLRPGKEVAWDGLRRPHHHEARSR